MCGSIALSGLTHRDTLSGSFKTTQGAPAPTGPTTVAQHTHLAARHACSA